MLKAVGSIIPDLPSVNDDLDGWIDCIALASHARNSMIIGATFWDVFKPDPSGSKEIEEAESAEAANADAVDDGDGIYRVDGRWWERRASLLFGRYLCLGTVVVHDSGIGRRLRLRPRGGCSIQRGDDQGPLGWGRSGPRRAIATDIPPDIKVTRPAIGTGLDMGLLQPGDRLAPVPRGWRTRRSGRSSGPCSRTEQSGGRDARDRDRRARQAVRHDVGLRDCPVQVQKGRVSALVGSSGAGKKTLLLPPCVGGHALPALPLHLQATFHREFSRRERGRHISVVVYVNMM